MKPDPGERVKRRLTRSGRAPRPRDVAFRRVSAALDAAVLRSAGRSSIALAVTALTAFEIFARPDC